MVPANIAKIVPPRICLHLRYVGIICSCTEGTGIKAQLLVLWLTCHHSAVWQGTECYHEERERKEKRAARAITQISWIISSLSWFSSSVPATHYSSNPARFSNPISTTWCSPSPARHVLSRRHAWGRKLHLQKQIDALQKRLAGYNRGGHWPWHKQYQPYQAQGAPHPISWAMSPPPCGTFFPSPFEFIFISQIHRITMPSFYTDLSNEVDYEICKGTPKRNTIEGMFTLLGVLLVKTCYSEWERSTSNCIGDFRYGRRLSEQSALKQWTKL